MATTANHVLLQRITLTDVASSVTFSGIPQTGYTDLKIVMSVRCDVASVAGYIVAAFNGSTSNFTCKGLYGNGSSAASFSSPGNFVGELVGNNATASTFSNLEMYIPNYAGSANKSYSVDSVAENNGTYAQATLSAGLWSVTTAISSMTFSANSANLAAGSSFSLYGIADVNTTPKSAPKADGGDIIKTDGTYWYHAFLSSGSFKPQVNLTADILVIAGGGGGGSGNNSGGGGAGGLLGFTSQALASTSTYTCTVGAGGATGTPNGVNGSDSQFGSLTLVKGGGYGGGDTNGVTPQIGNTGGSGGGSSYNYTSSGGSAISGQGYAGGAGQGAIAPDYLGGGGGGSAEAGNTDGLGYGGDGVSTYSSWGLATATGQNISGTVYYAGGGGGAGQASTTPRPGGDGGGGNGAGSSVATAGAAATGGGGGGSGNSAGNAGKPGGSGIIIVRYAV